MPLSSPWVCCPPDKGSLPPMRITAYELLFCTIILMLSSYPAYRNQGQRSISFSWISWGQHCRGVHVCKSELGAGEGRPHTFWGLLQPVWLCWIDELVCMCEWEWSEEEAMANMVPARWMAVPACEWEGAFFSFSFFHSSLHIYLYFPSLSFLPSLSFFFVFLSLYSPHLFAF